MSFYDGSAPVFIHTLTALSAILTKAETPRKGKIDRSRCIVERTAVSHDSTLSSGKYSPPATPP